MGPESGAPRGCLDLSDNGGAPPGTMKLHRALDSISLAYNPITKQLHFVSPTRPRRQATPPPPDEPKAECASDGEAAEEARGHRRDASTASSLSEGSSPKDEPKRGAFASLFSRGVLPWKSNGTLSSDCKTQSSEPNLANGTSLTWKLFIGRSNSVGCSSTDSLYLDTPGSSGTSTPLHHKRQGSTASAGEVKQFEDLVASSAALIQHNRPSNLPAKDTIEEQRHRAEYQRMLEAARQRELREAKERKRQLAKQARHEDDLSAALKEWNKNVLPFWDTMKNSRKTKELWWCGLPPAVRGKIWQLAIVNNLNITPQLYHICVEKARQKLIEAKIKKNGFSKNTTHVLNGTSHMNGHVSEHTQCHKLKSEEDCENSLSNGDNMSKTVQCNSDYTKTECSANHCSDEKVDPCERLKDTYIHRNFSEQNLKKYCDEKYSDDCVLKKAFQSNPNLCEYSNEWSMELIQLDIARTFPNLCIFQPGGPYFDVLHELLAAYVCYRPDVGYVQGMSFLAAILILNMDAPEAFICFANLLNSFVLRAAFTRDGATMQVLWVVYSHLMEANLPSVYKHFQNSQLGPELYLLEWLYSVFAKAMPLDVACRVWDVFLRDGDEFLFRTALGVLHMYQDKLVKLDFITAAQFLTKLPEDLCPDSLFKSINAINMTVDKLSFQQLVEKYKDNSLVTCNRDILSNIL